MSPHEKIKTLGKESLSSRHTPGHWSNKSYPLRGALENTCVISFYLHNNFMRKRLFITPLQIYKQAFNIN